MKRLTFICLVLIIAHSSYSQQYWQQEVTTKIEVKLDDKRHILNGYEELVYTNNSPDTLRYIYMHLWPNAYKNDHTPFANQQEGNHNTEFYYAPKVDRGYMDSLQFVVDGVSVDNFATEATPDISRIDLPKPLLPGKSVRISTPFRVKLPIVFSRNGHSGQAYYVSQWFPKPAVYDKKGWHPISYLDQGEFFSEFGSYDVSVSLPSNYVILATGNCTTESENSWLDSLAKVPVPDEAIYSKYTPASNEGYKTVNFKEDKVHDFAWFADKRYVVRKDTVYSPGNNKLVTTWAAFLPAYQKMWNSATDYLKTAVRNYGTWVGPYKYNTIKAVLGDMKAGGGMEYPTITLIDKVATAKLETVVIHEAGHNWFYGMLASNERDHAWMDEGLNSFYEQKATAKIHNDTAARKKNKVDEALLYYEFAATREDQPINLHAAEFRSTNYGVDVYYKTAVMLHWLESYMGEEQFEAGMKAYFDTWCQKHPGPDDFRTIMQQHTDKSISWFFDDILNTDKPVDYAVTRAKNKDGNTELTIKNNSGVSGPVHIGAYHNGLKTGDVWSAPFTGKTKVMLTGRNWDKLRVESDIPDAKSANDGYRKRALFHHFGIKVKPLAGINRSEKDKLFIAPALGNNQHDGIMAGLMFHNITIPQNRFVFALAPMYSFRTKDFTGAGSVGYSWYPQSVFKEVMLLADAKSFHSDETIYNLKQSIFARYTKVAPTLLFTFHEKDARSSVTRSISLRGYNITEDEINYGADSAAIPSLSAISNNYGLVRYIHNNERTFNPFSYALEGHGNADFAKLNIEGNIRINYYAKNKSLYVRGYFGKFFAINQNPAVTNRYLLNAAYGGQNDYLYDGTYRGRNTINDFSGQQISAMQEGGFKIPILNGAYRSDNWLAALNLKTDLPKINLPIRLFVDAGLIPNPSPGFKNIKSTLLMYDAGVEVYISKNILSFYFPLIMSNDFHNFLATTYGNKNVFVHSISFTLHLQNINWLRSPTSFLKGLM